MSGGAYRNHDLSVVFFCYSPQVQHVRFFLGGESFGTCTKSPYCHHLHIQVDFGVQAIEQLDRRNKSNCVPNGVNFSFVFFLFFFRFFVVLWLF